MDSFIYLRIHLLFFKSLPEGMFREVAGMGERERGRSVAFHTHPDWGLNLPSGGMCPDRDSNPSPFGARMTLLNKGGMLGKWGSLW